MTKSSRDELLQKRLALQEQLKREAQRARIAPELAALDAAGVSYEVIWPEAVNALWVAQCFPQSATGIDWAAIPGARQIEWQSEPQRNQNFCQLLAHYAGDDSQALLVVWSDGNTPALRINCADLCRQCALILDANFEVWVSAIHGNWLVECQSTGQLRAGEWPVQATR